MAKFQCPFCKKKLAGDKAYALTLKSDMALTLIERNGEVWMVSDLALKGIQEAIAAKQDFDLDLLGRKIGTVKLRISHAS